MSNKFFIVIFVLFAVVVIGAGCAGSSTLNSNGKILFYRTDCPHCKNVEAFIEKNDVRNKVAYDYLEVSSDKTNINLMLEKAKICNIPLDEVGVPFFWDGSKCLVGDQPIIDYLSAEIKK